MRRPNFSALNVQLSSRTCNREEAWTPKEVQSGVGDVHAAVERFGVDECVPAATVTRIYSASFDQLIFGAAEYTLTGDIVTDLTATCARLTEDNAPSELFDAEVPGSMRVTFGELGARSQVVGKMALMPRDVARFPMDRAETNEIIDLQRSIVTLGDECPALST